MLKHCLESSLALTRANWLYWVAETNIRIHILTDGGKTGVDGKVGWLKGAGERKETG